MPDLMVYADKGLKGISRTGGTLLGADCSTEKMPAAIRLSFAGDADGLAMLADRHGANILSAQEPTTGVTPAWAAAHQNHADVVQLLDKRGALLGVAGMDIPFDYLIETLLTPSDVPIQEAFLLDAEGHIVVRSRGEQQPDPSSALSTEVFPDAEVVSAVRERRNASVSRGEDQYWVFPLDVLGWSYVVNASVETLVAR